MKLPGAKTHPLARRRSARPSAIAVVVLLTIITLFAENHCVLSGMKAPPAGAHSCCATPPVPQPDANYSACCASLAAPLPGQAVVPEVSPFALHSLWLAPATGLALAIAPRPAGALTRTHAPPGSSFFCELVLARSLPAHAPPPFVA